jgi:hypothetical protein
MLTRLLLKNILMTGPPLCYTALSTVAYADHQNQSRLANRTRRSFHQFRNSHDGRLSSRM